MNAGWISRWLFVRAVAGWASVVVAGAGLILAFNSIDAFRFSNTHERVIDNCLETSPLITSVVNASREQGKTLAFVLGYEIKFVEDTVFTHDDLEKAIEYSWDIFGDISSAEKIQRFLSFDQFGASDLPHEEVTKDYLRKKSQLHFTNEEFRDKVNLAEEGFSKIKILSPEEGEEILDWFIDTAHGNRFYVESVFNHYEHRNYNKVEVDDMATFSAARPIREACEQAVKNRGVFIEDQSESLWSLDFLK